MVQTLGPVYVVVVAVAFPHLPPISSIRSPAYHTNNDTNIIKQVALSVWLLAALVSEAPGIAAQARA